MPRGGYRVGAGRKKKVPGAPPPLPMRRPAATPDRQTAADARESALAFLRDREQGLIDEVWEKGTIRDRLEMWRVIKTYGQGVPRQGIDVRAEPSFEQVMAAVARERAEAAKQAALVTTAETVSVRQISEDAGPQNGGTGDGGENT